MASASTADASDLETLAQLLRTSDSDSAVIEALCYVVGGTGVRG